jgi:hypothetical protein
VQSDKLATEEIVSRRNTARDSDGELATIGDEVVYSPLATGETSLIDLEPSGG